MKQKLHPKSVWLFFFWPTGPLVALLWALVPIVIIGFAWGGNALLQKTSLVTLPWVKILGIIFLFGVILDYIWARLFYNSYFFELTEDNIKIERGVIYKKYISIPYERIQNVDICRGLMARILRLSDLQIQTAGYSGAILTEGRLPGLLPEDAEKIREDLIQRIEPNRGERGL